MHGKWMTTNLMVQNTWYILKRIVHAQLLTYNGCLAIIALACCLCKVMANLWYNWLATHGFAWLVQHEILSARVAKTGLLSKPHPPNVYTAMGMNRMFWVEGLLDTLCFSAPPSSELHKAFRLCTVKDGIVLGWQQIRLWLQVSL